MVYLRVWQNLDLEAIKQGLLVVGELSAECFNCRRLGIENKSRACPDCGTAFSYVGFRRKIKPQDLNQFQQAFPGAKLIDFADFKSALNKKEARKMLDI